MPNYPDYFLPDEPKLSFWGKCKQILKRDWLTLLLMILGIGGWYYIITIII